MKAIIFAITLLSTGLVYSQYDTSKVYISLGANMGMPVFQNLAEQPFGIDDYLTNRQFSFYLSAGLGIDISKRIQLEFGYTHNGLAFDKRVYRESQAENFPDHIVLMDDYSDVTNSSNNSLKFHEGSVRFNFTIPRKSIHFVPYVGIGVGRWNHRNYEFVLKELTSNQFTIYSVHQKARVQISYSAGFKFAIAKWPNVFIDFNYHGMGSSFNYMISTESTDDVTNWDHFIVKHRVHSFTVGLNLRGRFLSEKKRKRRGRH
ncbi:MAG: outer membrane beta-barrel protein [Crocinitomicaceae bacterium]|nr:outer membrane beta-barrel protein [Crocinitomicaceae bacterium]